MTQVDSKELKRIDKLAQEACARFYAASGSDVTWHELPKGIRDSFYAAVSPLREIQSEEAIQTPLPQSRYKMFLNYLHNDLGISRSDVKEWSQQAIKSAAEKMVGQIDVRGIAQKAVTNLVSSEVREIRAELAREIAKNISLSIRVDSVESREG